jgi:CheY-like chemotaxis protein
MLPDDIPDVLVSDIGMPKVDGYALIRRIRRRAPARGGRTPAIALTAYTRPEDGESALAAGFQAHLTKPVDPERLRAAVATLAGQSRAVQLQVSKDSGIGARKHSRRSRKPR